MTNYLVSIIIPCFNAEKFVEEGVRSIMNQSYENLEIICINDGSIDNTLKILEKLASEDDRIIVINNETNLKLIKTLNYGIQLAQGDYIARMDADDISFPERIRKQLAFINDNNLDVIGSFSTYIVGNTNRQKENLSYLCTSQNSILFSSFFQNPISHPTLFAKTEILKANQYLDIISNHVIEDYELWVRLLNKGFKFGIIPEVLLYYRINPESESHKHNINQSLNHFKLVKNHLAQSLNVKIEDNLLKKILAFEPCTKPYEIDLVINQIYYIKVEFLKKNKNTLTRLDKKEIKYFIDLKITYLFFNQLKSNNILVYSIITLFFGRLLFLNKYFHRLILMHLREIFSLPKI